MTRSQPFTLIYDPDVANRLRSIAKKHHPLIRSVIEEQLQHEPAVESRNRKPLQQPAAFEATWELRLGPKNCFRVLYAVDLQWEEVHILAIGVKDRNRLIVGGEEIEL
jgi:hypothetical protein